MPYPVKQKNPRPIHGLRSKLEHDALTIREKVTKAATWERYFLLCSDTHRDSPWSNGALERRLFDEALSREAGIIHLGDLWDVMQGRNDRRRSMAELKDVFKRDDYFNAVVDEAFEFYRKYAGNMLMLAEGNHEAAVKRHCGINLTHLLAERLRAEGSPVEATECNGWIQYKISGSKYHSATMYYTHGSGGSAPVTRGVIKTARRAVYLPDADIVLSGHNHQVWSVVVPRLRLTDGGVCRREDALHVQVGTIKGAGEWERSMEMAPVSEYGWWWLKFCVRHIDGIQRLTWDVSRAL